MSKFDSPETERLYGIAMEGGASAETGDVQIWGYYWMFDADTNHKAAIMCEDNQGFVESEEFDSQEEAQRRWDDIEAEITESTDDDDESLQDSIIGSEGNAGGI